MPTVSLTSAGDVSRPDSSWADADEATIHPGVQMVTNGSQCTANFIFERFVEVDEVIVRQVFIGYAAHCAGKGESTDTNGCLVDSEALGTQVQIDGATQPGTLVYSSWGTMRATAETNADACDYNDFALVQIDEADFDRINPSVPVMGGPTALGGATGMLDEVYNYGNSSLRLGVAALSPKFGYSLGTKGNGWSHTVYTVTPGIPGDSGSGFMDADGAAFGVTSTVALFPYALSNGISDLALGLEYANAGPGPDFELAIGTEAFVGYP